MRPFVYVIIHVYVYSERTYHCSWKECGDEATERGYVAHGPAYDEKDESEEIIVCYWLSGIGSFPRAIWELRGFGNYNVAAFGLYRQAVCVSGSRVWADVSSDSQLQRLHVLLRIFPTVEVRRWLPEYIGGRGGVVVPFVLHLKSDASLCLHAIIYTLHDPQRKKKVQTTKYIHSQMGLSWEFPLVLTRNNIIILASLLY